MTPLPVVDIGGFSSGTREHLPTAAAVEHALTQTGFMIVTGHGIDPALIEQAFSVSRQFFGLTRELKNRYAYTDVDTNFGYQGIEVEQLDPRSLPDLKESFTMRNAVAYAEQPERWPPGGFRDVALALYAASLGAAHRILEILASCLELPADFFAQRHGGENVTLRFLHYPAGLPLRSSAQLGAGAHTDYGSITLLFQDDVGGLELLGGDGSWHLTPPLPGAAVINTGDLMERWTNGRFRSTLHRVRPIAAGRDRYSIALFVDPDSAVQVTSFDSCVTADQPARYPMITAGEHIRQKIAATREAMK